MPFSPVLDLSEKSPITTANCRVRENEVFPLEVRDQKVPLTHDVGEVRERSGALISTVCSIVGVLPPWSTPFV